MAALGYQVTRLEEISPGSEEELEIRGCSVEAVERMREAIAAKFLGAYYVVHFTDERRGESEGTLW